MLFRVEDFRELFGGIELFLYLLWMGIDGSDFHANGQLVSFTVIDRAPLGRQLDKTPVTRTGDGGQLVFFQNLELIGPPQYGPQSAEKKERDQINPEPDPFLFSHLHGKTLICSGRASFRPRLRVASSRYCGDR